MSVRLLVLSLVVVLSAAPAEGALSVSAVGDGVKLQPTEAVPHSRIWDPTSRTVRLAGARGETVAFQLVLSGADRSLRQVRVDPGQPLRGDRGHLPDTAIEMFRVEHLVVTDVPSPKISTGGPGEYPDPLIPLRDPYDGRGDVAQPFDIPAARLQPVWVDIAIPRDAAAGDYRGTLVVRAEAEPATEIVVAVTVRDFELPRTPHLAAWVPLYQGRLLRGEHVRLRDTDDFVRLVHRYAAMAETHRFVTQLYEFEPRTEWDWQSGQLVSIDWTDYDRLYGPILDGRIGAAPVVWMAPLSEEWAGFDRKAARPLSVIRPALQAYVREMVRHFQDRGWPLERTFVYPVDEPSPRRDPAVFEKLMAYAEAVRASADGRLRFFLTSPPHVPSMPSADRDRLGDLIDIWAVPPYAYVPARIRPYQARGAEGWFYQYHPPFVGGSNVTDHGLGFRTWPWIAWKYAVDGVYLWCGNFWRGDPYRNPRNWSVDLQGNGILFYPGGRLPGLGLPAVGGPVSSFRMKALRRGLQDYDYLWLARSLGRGADVERIVDRLIRTALNEHGHSPHWRHPQWMKGGAWSHDPEEWDRARDELAGLIAAALPRPREGRP